MGDVERPVLTRTILRADGSRAVGLRVFCGRAHTSIPLEVCVRCSVYRTSGRDPEGRERIFCEPPCGPKPAMTAGAALGLGGGAMCVDANVPGPSVSAALASTGGRPVLVVGRDGSLAGVIRDEHLRGRVRSWMTAHDLMAPARGLWEGAPLHDAIVAMAKAHQRFVALVTATGEPVGVLPDVEAMGAMSR